MVMGAGRPDRYISALCLHRPGPRHSAAIRDARSENLAKYDQFLRGAAGFSIAPVAGGEEGGGAVAGPCAVGMCGVG